MRKAGWDRDLSPVYAGSREPLMRAVTNTGSKVTCVIMANARGPIVLPTSGSGRQKTRTTRFEFCDAHS